MTGSTGVTQEQLDSTQYTETSIRLYESVFGEDFVSPGGRAMAVEFVEDLNLKAGSRVLDVGCGLGGSAFVMAGQFHLLVDGIDLSNNMLAIANTKLVAHGLQEQVTLEHGDCLKINRPGYYDAVYSRDVFLHINDKARLFGTLKQSLRPGGRLLFTDYCCGDKPWGKDFEAYVSDRGYSLHTPPDYADLVAEAGFQQVEYQDLTPRFIEILAADLEKIATLDLDVETRGKLAQSWQGKLQRAQSGDHRWVSITGSKPV